MGRPSNPRLMARVLEAVKHLGEGRGSSAKQVLEVLREGNRPPTRNLTMQVQRALKNAVTAGLLQLRSGRYKMLISLQNTLKNRGGGVSNGNKTTVSNTAGKKKDEVEDAKDSGSSETVDAGPKSRYPNSYKNILIDGEVLEEGIRQCRRFKIHDYRCSHCKKHKRKASRRRRKRSSKRRRRPTKQAAERKSRKLRRQGEEEVSNRRERRRKMAAPGARSQGEVPNGQRSERPGKKDPKTNEDEDMRESVNRRDRSESSSSTDGEEEGPKTTKAKLSGGRKTASSPPRSASKPRRSSRNRKSSVQNMAENDSEESRMECCDEDGHRSEEPGEEDANVREKNGGSGISI